ncbi:hypothetical protein E8E12_005620 [Didymella heteroderae]|uniref:Uncharacterized protein n=1 Tax=Didymella heteroderae TaxID=1769908 RepID=A0A9P4WN16_9PLEO|nr:hypothetical protein E8E12_005620 [Didymella heteroderae]
MLGFAIVFAAFAGLTVAQNSTVEFFWPSAVTWEVPAITIQSVNSSATIMHIGCPRKQKSSCEWGHMNYTIFDQSTYEATMTNASYSITRTCVAKETPSVQCYMEGSDDAGNAAFAGTENWFADAFNEVVATVDVGAELLAAATAVASGSGPSPAAGSSATATVSPTNSPQATGAAAEVRPELAVMLLGAAAAAMYI